MLWPVRCLYIAASALALAATWEGRMGLSITSTAFKEGGPIPIEYTCDGADLSPPLAWSGVPEGTAVFALIADDPDAPARAWVHWVLYDVPATFGGVPGNVSKVEAPQELKGATQGRNDSRRIGYGGPCPPPGPAHRYFFKLYALAAPLRLNPGASKQEVERAMGGHMLATAELIGTYARQAR
jgi:Raf kinase inhibitor-like YbhB/YbcL family protein